MKHTLFLLCLICNISSASFGQTPDTSNALPLFLVQYTTGPAWDTTKAPTQQQAMKEHSALMQKLRKEGTTLLGARYSGDFL